MFIVTSHCSRLTLLLLTTLLTLRGAVSDDQVINRTFALGAGAAPEIVVTIVSGSIRVTTHSAASVAFNAKVHLESADAAGLANLKNRLRLESEQSGPNIWIGLEAGVDSAGPPPARSRREFGWRANRGVASGRRGEDHHNQDRFRHDIELQVPRSAHLKLRTVNGGDIEVDGVTGEFEFSNVNGGITLKHATGSGRAHTVNGAVTLAFDAHPTGPVSIKTVNGPVRLLTPANLNASVRLKTLHGKVHSDFPMTLGAATTAPPPGATEQGMKRIWRANNFSPGRIGPGTGPAIDINTLNGSIDILENRN